MMRGGRRHLPSPDGARRLHTYVVFRLDEPPGLGEPFGCLDAPSREAALKGARCRWPGIAGLRVQAAGSVPVAVLIRALTRDGEATTAYDHGARDVAGECDPRDDDEQGATRARGEAGHGSRTAGSDREDECPRGGGGDR